MSWDFDAEVDFLRLSNLLHLLWCSDSLVSAVGDVFTELHTDRMNEFQAVQ